MSAERRASGSRFRFLPREHFRERGRLGGGLVLAVTILTCCTAPTLSQDVPPTTATTTPAPVTVTTKVEPQHVTVGTPFRYTMRIEVKGNVEVRVPILADRLGDFVIQDFGDVPHDKKPDGSAVIERWYTLVTYEAGDHTVPGAPVQYREPGGELQRADTPEALVIIDSLLPKNEDALKKAAVRDIKGPVAVPHDYRPLWYGVAALAALAGLAYGASALIKRRREVRQPLPRPAHEIALEALVRLQSARLLEQEQHAEYYVQLSAIVRAYLEQRFNLRAPEMTTEEFLQAAQRDRQLPVEHRGSLTQFLNEADLVKFARYVPTADDAERAYRAARQFVESTALRAEADRAAA